MMLSLMYVCGVCGQDSSSYYKVNKGEVEEPISRNSSQN